MYFSDRESEASEGTEEEFSENSWAAILAVVWSRIADGSFALRFPMICEDHEKRAVYATDEADFHAVRRGQIPELGNHLDSYRVPPTLAILDFLEFCYRYIARPVKNPGMYHDFYGHWHLTFGKEAGQKEFRVEINQILKRNGLVYTVQEDGSVIRLTDRVLFEKLHAAIFATGDEKLDALLESARRKFLDPDGESSLEGLQVLWDAWERLKSLEDPNNKRASVEKLLESTTKNSSFRERLDREATELTDIGNKFGIRHSEVNQIKLKSGDLVDYLFERLYVLIHLILRRTDRLM